MSEIINKEDQFFDVYFDKHLKEAQQSGEVILAYDGVLNTETISKLESEIENKILEKGFPKAVIKKVFFICVESLQNLLIHGNKDDNGAQHNYFVLSSNANSVKLQTANLVATSNIEKLTHDIAVINGFENSADLKSYYLEHLEKNELSDKGGAGLGFITIGMKSGNKMVPEFFEINAIRSLFSLKITINVD